MHVTLIGRPATVVPREDTVVMLMTGSPAPDLPHGLPKPPIATTTYTIYVAADQWRSVAGALADQQSALLIKGWACHDPETESLAVFTQSITTTHLR